MHISDKKIHAVEGFIKSVEILSQIEIAPFEDKLAREKFINDDKLQLNEICYFLNAVIFEIIIKIFYEIEHKKPSDKTHDINQIYNKLLKEDQKYIFTEYEKLRKSLIEKINFSKKGRIANIRYCNLREAFKINKEIITNYKCNCPGTPRNNFLAS